jgi:hypothetical protein
MDRVMVLRDEQLLEKNVTAKIVMNLGRELSRDSNNVMIDNQSNQLIFENEQRPGS